MIGGVLAHVLWIRIARLAFVIAALVLLPFTLSNSIRQRLSNIDLVAHKLEAEASPNDLIVLNPWNFAPSFYRYYHGLTPWITVPTMSEYRIHRYDLMKSKTMELDPLAEVRSAIRPQAIEGFLTIARTRYLEAFQLEGHLHHLADRIVILDQQDFFS